jgi:hypothetical protein
MMENVLFVQVVQGGAFMTLTRQLSVFSDERVLNAVRSSGIFFAASGS